MAEYPGGYSTAGASGAEYPGGYSVAGASVAEYPDGYSVAGASLVEYPGGYSTAGASAVPARGVREKGGRLYPRVVAAVPPSLVGRMVSSATRWHRPRW